MFSRLEYALKRTPEYAVERSSHTIRWVEANWIQFARDHKDDFKPKRTEQLAKAVEYLLDHPPARQILEKGVLAWEPTVAQGNSDFEKLIYSVKGVRNNLFHGGKFPIKPAKDPGRDKRLLESCNEILKECLLLNDNIRNLFRQ